MSTNEEIAPEAGSPPLERRLATILCADVAGYSHMMGIDEERTVRVFRGHREIFESLVKLHRGRIFNTAGDALLAEFNSAVEAVRCATEIQAALRSRNEHLAPEEKMLFRMGINLGDVIVQHGDLLGDGVNVAARIQTSTEPGGICISGSVYDQIQNKLSLDFKLLGEKTYKNIARPVRTFTINEGPTITRPVPRRSWKTPVAVAAAVLAIAAAGWWGYELYAIRSAQQARVQSELAAQLAAQKQATEQARRVAEDAQRDAQVLAQKQAADEALRRAQQERSLVERERKLLETEKRAAAVPALPAESPAPAASVVPKSAAPFDGLYSGRLCNQLRNQQRPQCWQVSLVIRDGIVGGSWFSRTKQTSKASGTVDAAGTVELRIAGWSRDGNPAKAVLTGRVVDDAITAAGQWRSGGAITGEWKRTP